MIIWNEYCNWDCGEETPLEFWTQFPEDNANISASEKQFWSERRRWGRAWSLVSSVLTESNSSRLSKRNTCHMKYIYTWLCSKIRCGLCLSISHAGAHPTFMLEHDHPKYWSLPLLKLQHGIPLDLGSPTWPGLVSSPTIDPEAGLIHNLRPGMTMTGLCSPD